MNKYLIFLALLAFSFSSCEKDPILSELPDCVQKLVKDLKNSAIGNPPYQLYSYTYEGNTVYYTPAQCCDQLSTAYNADCEIICRPTGGWIGYGDGTCIDFFDVATDEKLIWEDDRE